MPKAQRKRTRGTRGRERHATSNSVLEKDDMPEGDGDGKSSIPVKNIVFFKAYIREAGLLYGNNGCGGEARTRKSF